LYTKVQIKSLLGKDELSRIEARHLGGLSGQKGLRYEDLFAVFRLSQLAAGCFRGRNGRFADQLKVRVRTQTFAIVDDLSVVYVRSSTVDHYQLKDVKQLSWGSGKTSIAKDFANQLRLSRNAGWKARVILVVSSPQLRARLQAKRPNGAVLVEYFPAASGMDLMIRACPAFRRALVALSPFHLSNAETEKLVSLAKFILGHWVDASKGLHLRKLVKRLNQETGTYCRPIRGSRPLPKRVRKILSAIPHLSCRMSKGFLFWRYGKGDSGRFPHHCWTGEFKNLMQHIAERQPRRFEELENRLQ
jgi:hypothetical protein